MKNAILAFAMVALLVGCGQEQKAETTVQAPKAPVAVRGARRSADSDSMQAGLNAGLSTVGNNYPSNGVDLATELQNSFEGR